MRIILKYSENQDLFWPNNSGFISQKTERTVTVKLLLSNIGVGSAKLPHRTNNFDMSII